MCAYAEYNGLKKRVNGIKRKKKRFTTTRASELRGRTASTKKEREDVRRINAKRKLIIKMVINDPKTKGNPTETENI